MRVEFRPYFQLQQYDSTKIQSIVLNEEHGTRDVFPHEIALLFDLKHQVEMMLDGRNELPWNRLASQAEELELCFKRIVKDLDLKPRFPK